MAHGAGLLFDLIAKDGASPAFLRVAGAADKAAAATARAERGVTTASAKIASAGAKLTKGLTLPLAAVAAVGIDQAMKWQKSMTLIQTAGGETAAKTAVLSKGLLSIAKDTGTSLDQLGEGIYTIAKAGAQKWSAVDQLTVMKAAAQGAKAENVDLGTATDALSTIMLDYHLNASKAVSTENQLIRASGLAKTSFGDFSKSLSSVVPIAAALGVSIPEITGAIATMTQHGVNPQQATENARNLLFNLAGQNNVASQAMQQLGINTVDLAKNLGSRGLTGTLAIVDKALRDHTRNGMVVVDVHKAAALATRSLSEMLGQMTGPLEKQSKGLLTGQVNIKDYTKFAKSLGGQAGASALQFIALYKNAAGFSNQLRSGNGTITTTTAQYAKLLGGMTGASVAMQIAGKYAKDNARNVHEVGKAALEAGSDVLGWNKTQDTLAVKMGKAKVSLQVLAVEIGTALIPAVSKIVDGVGKAVHWFENLSGTQKKMLGWSLGVLAALGPVLTIGTRLATVGTGLGKFVGGVSTRLATFAGATETTSTRVGKAARGMSAALVGIGAGAVIGSLTRTGSTATKVGGMIASAAIGAAVGWGQGGPLGAALGGLGGLISSAVTAFGLFGSSAKAQVKPTDDFTQAILRDNDALGTNTRALLIHKLNAEGAYDAALKLGISQKTLTDAMMGNATAMAQVNGAMAPLKALLSTPASGYGSGGWTKQTRDQVDAYDKLAATLPGVSETLKVNQHAADNEAAANGKAATAAKAHTKVLNALGKMDVAPKVSANTVSLTRLLQAARKRINAIRQDKVPNLRVHTSAADAEIKRLRGMIDSLRDKFLTIHIRQVVESAPKLGIHADFSDVGYGKKYKSAAAAVRAAAATQPGRSAAENAAAKLLDSNSQLSTADQMAASQAASDRAAAAKQAASDRAAAVKQAAQDRAAAVKQAYDTSLANARSRLATARQNYSGAKSTVRSAFTGSFDVTQAGQNQFGFRVTFSAMKRQLDKAVADAKRFTQALHRLGREGLNKSLIQMLADAGPSALPQALALLSATPKQLRAFNAEYGQLGKYGNATGKQVADQMYGAGVKSAEGLVNGLLSKRGAVNKAVKSIADGMVTTLRKELNMHSPSRRLFDEGAMAFEGYKQGIESQQKPVEKAARGVAGASIPGGATSGGLGATNGVGGPAIGELHLHYLHPDDYHRATATAMRAATTVLR